MSSLADLLLGRTRAAVLGALLLSPDTSLHVRELARLTGASPGSLHRELRALAELGLLVRDEVGRQVHYRADTSSPIYEELAGLLRKTSGLGDVLRDALAPLKRTVSMAFVYGSMADGTQRAASDIDVMVLGTASFASVVRALVTTHAVLRREVNPTVMSPQEFEQRLRSGDGFALGVARGERVWLLGGEDDFAELAADRAAQATRGDTRRSTAAPRRHRP